MNEKKEEREREKNCFILYAQRSGVRAYKKMLFAYSFASSFPLDIYSLLKTKSFLLACKQEKLNKYCEMMATSARVNHKKIGEAATAKEWKSFENWRVNYGKQDHQHTFWYCNFCTMQWFIVHKSWICFFFVSVTAAVATAFRSPFIINKWMNVSSECQCFRS